MGMRKRAFRNREVVVARVQGETATAHIEEGKVTENEWFYRVTLLKGDLSKARREGNGELWLNEWELELAKQPTVEQLAKMLEMVRPKREPCLV